MEDYFHDNGWVSAQRDYTLKEETMTRAQEDAERLYNGEQNKCLDLLYTPHKRHPLELKLDKKSLELTLVRKMTKRSKKDLRGFWDTLVPGSVVTRTSPATTVT